MFAYRYIRFSSKAQERGTSVERQEIATKAMCAKRGWQVAETLCDLGRSAWKGDHLRVGNLGKFKARVDAGEIERGSVLVIENMDRLSRQDVRLARRWVEDVTAQGILIAVCSPEIVLDDEALSGNNIAAMVQYLLEAGRSTKESERKQGFSLGMWEKHREGARAGRIFTARCPGWLRVVGKGEQRYFEEVPERAKTVQLVYELAAEGLGIVAICKRLNEAGIKPWGLNFYRHPPEIFAARYVRDILASPAVEGEYHPKKTGVYTGERIERYYPRIVEAGIVAKARAAVNLRKSTGSHNREEAANLFTGKVRCGQCRRPMVRTVGHNKYGVRFEYLRCSNHRQGGTCSNKGHFRYDLFEKAALDQILTLALDNTHFTKPDEAKVLVAGLADTDKSIENKRAEQQRLLAFIMRNPEADEAEQMLNTIRPELAALQAKRDGLQVQLDAAKGTVTPEEHLQRVMQVSKAIYSDDVEVRRPARRQVRNAVFSVVDSVVCKEQPEKLIEMSLAGGRIGYVSDHET